MPHSPVFAHTGCTQDGSDWQLLSDHLAETSRLASARAARLGLGPMAALAGAYHDFGKHDPTFQEKLFGKVVRVDHSTAGAKVLMEKAPSGLVPIAEILAYAVLGHHAGLPDREEMAERLDNHRYRVSQDVRDACQPDLLAAGRALKEKIAGAADVGFAASVATRMVFSCLVDADFRDTEAFYDALECRKTPRNWETLQDLLPRLLVTFNAHMAGFSDERPLNRLRNDILHHVRARATLPPGIFTLTVPTGGGKTLASLGFALDHAVKHGHQRIIYALPYTSIIDQTAWQFRDLFGVNVVLEHHSAIDIETPLRGGFSSREKLRLAMEDWAAPIVVTTNVQLFESLFAARPSRCRKLHNIAGSVIVLDEAQVMPRPLLLPTLRMIDTLARDYGCTIVLCTATQPAFDSEQLACRLHARELAPDPLGLSHRLRRAKIVQGGEITDNALIAALRAHTQALIIVNSRKHALALYSSAKAEGLEGIVHLSTRQFPAHRRRILALIRARLKDGLPCRLIATSLVEAGVDVDFPIGWRAEAGLDSVVQAAGRINREGRRDWQESPLTVFTAPDNEPPPEVAQMARAMRKTAGKFDDLSAPGAIRDWFNEVYWTKGSQLDKHDIMGKLYFTNKGTSFAFRTIADVYRMVDSRMVPVIVPLDEDAIKAVADLAISQIPSALLARALQSYTVQIPAKARDVMRANGKGSFHHPDLRGDQFFVLDAPSLYHDETGLHWEEAEFLAAEQWVL